MLNFGCWLPFPEEIIETAHKNYKAQLASSEGFCSNPYISTEGKSDGSELTLVRQNLPRFWSSLEQRELKFRFVSTLLVKMSLAQVVFKNTWIQEQRSVAGIQLVQIRSSPVKWQHFSSIKVSKHASEREMGCGVVFAPISFLEKLQKCIKFCTRGTVTDFRDF